MGDHEDVAGRDRPTQRDGRGGRRSVDVHLDDIVRKVDRQAGRVVDLDRLGEGRGGTLGVFGEEELRPGCPGDVRAANEHADCQQSGEERWGHALDVPH